MTDTVDVAVIGAGAAGLAAARMLATSGSSFVLLEASHRIGGRAHTEFPPDGGAFDLGCHWLHSASRNPFVDIADELGIRYEKRNGYGPVSHFRTGRWLRDDELSSLEVESAAAEDAMARSWSGGHDMSVFDATQRDGEWTAVLDYYTALNTSSDPDQVSIGDMVSYEDTHENWPVIDGYGQLVERWGSAVAVSLNTQVNAVRWNGSGVRVETSSGDVVARRAIVTVSTGVLASGTLRFLPNLPEHKQAAIAALPLGNYNHVRFWVDHNHFADDVPERIVVELDDDSPIMLTIRPHGFDCVIAIFGGRYADWLERAGPATSAKVVEEALCSVFGNEICRHIQGDRQSAWRGNPFVLGAYSSALPGQFHQRPVLAEPIADRLYFGGEATSTRHFCTCHGAMMSGQRAAQEVLDAIAAD